MFLWWPIKPNYLVILPTNAAPQFLWKLIPLFISFAFDVHQKFEAVPHE